MKQHLKRAGLMALGVVFIVVGVISFALPFMQGFLFIAIGLMLLSITSPRLRRWLTTHTAKYPKLHHAVLRAEAWILRKIGPVD